jgi:predicted metal-dependent hydrolase
MDINFEYTLVRSDRRTLCIEISRDKRVTVRAPISVSDERIADFIKRKSRWVEKHLSKMKPIGERSDEEIEFLRKKASEEIPPRVEYWSNIMGLYPLSVKITAAKKRYGSCSSKNRLCFSLYLAEYPPEAVDYVVVHELAHIKIKNHSRDFHALVGKYLPDQEERKKILKIS